MNTKLHAMYDSQGRPLNLLVTAGRVSDYIGARALVSNLPKVEWLLGDRGYDADRFRGASKAKCISACNPGRRQRKTPIKYDRRRYKRPSRIEIMFGRLKDWRRVATRCDRCLKVSLSAIALPATVIYWTISPDPKREAINECDRLSERVPGNYEKGTLRRLQERRQRLSPAGQAAAREGLRCRDGQSRHHWRPVPSTMELHNQTTTVSDSVAVIVASVLS